MAIQFPSNPETGDQFTDVITNISYEWTGVFWRSTGPGTGVGATGPKGEPGATGVGPTGATGIPGLIGPKGAHTHTAIISQVGSQ